MAAVTETKRRDLLTAKELAAVERGHYGPLTKLVRRLVATVRAAQTLEHWERVDAIVSENEELRWRLKLLEEAGPRVLIVAEQFPRAVGLEVYATEHVRLGLVELPETRTAEEYEAELEWELRSLPRSLRTITEEIDGIKRHPFTLRAKP